MNAEQLAVLADDIADMAQDFITTRDVTSLRNMATNLANMIRLHFKPAAALAAADAPCCTCRLVDINGRKSVEAANDCPIHHHPGQVLGP
jgi:hypothetical protein